MSMTGLKVLDFTYTKFIKWKTSLKNERNINNDKTVEMKNKLDLISWIWEDENKEYFY